VTTSVQAAPAFAPKKHETTDASDLFRVRLDQIINMKHELVQLASCGQGGSGDPAVSAGPA
jgi:hypothetical protein